VFCIRRSGRMTPEEKMAPADLAVPYEAPNTVKTMATEQPIAPKKDCFCVVGYGFLASVCCLSWKEEGGSGGKGGGRGRGRAGVRRRRGCFGADLLVGTQMASKDRERERGRGSNCLPSVEIDNVVHLAISGYRGYGGVPRAEEVFVVKR